MASALSEIDTIVRHMFIILLLREKSLVIENSYNAWKDHAKNIQYGTSFAPDDGTDPYENRDGLFIYNILAQDQN